MKKENNLGFLLYILVFLVYFSLHFTFVYHGDKTMLGFALAPLSVIFSNSQGFDGIFLSRAELETSLGTIRIKPFCRFYAHNRYLVSIGEGNFRNGKAEHNISIFGNILENPFISFEYNDIEMIALNQIMDIQGRFIHADHAYPLYNKNRDIVDIVINFKVNPDMADNKIILSDGTQIGFRNDYQNDLFLAARVAHDAASRWEIEAGRMFNDNGYFLVTRSEWDKPEKFISITFEENWGKFIDGERKIE
jgi:hypothetical protein